MLCDTGVERARELLIGWDRVALRSLRSLKLHFLKTPDRRQPKHNGPSRMIS